jgi:hypothetical protein
MKHHDFDPVIAWAAAHPIASLSFLACVAAWGATSDGVRVPYWVMWWANFAAAEAAWHVVIRPWLLGW